MENFPTVPVYTDHSNGSIIYPEDGELFSAVCYSLIFGLSLPSNSFLLWVLLGERGKRTPPDCLLLQLTISDLCLTMTLPFWASYQLHGWTFGDWTCKMMSGLCILGLNSYMTLLTAMSLDRYVAVVHAASPSAQGRRVLWVRRASIGIWLVCVAVSIWEAYNYETAEHDDVGVILCEETLDPRFQLLNYYLHIGLFCLLPFTIIFFCYFRICVTIRRCSIKGQRQAIRLILGLTVVFFICWAPYNIVLFLDTLTLLEVESLDKYTLWYAYYITHTLAYCHCCLNPLFHVFGAEKFRRHLPLPGIASYRSRESRQTGSSTIDSQRHHAVSQQTCV